MIHKRFLALFHRYAALSRLKKISLFCLFAHLILCMGSYVAFYNIGWLRYGGWAFSYLLIWFLCLVILSITLVITWIVSLWRPKDRLWTSAVLLSFVVLPALGGNVFGPSGGMRILGVRDHIIRVCSLDDLRHFAQHIHSLGEMDNPSPFARRMHGTDKNIDILHGDVSWLTAQQRAVYEKLQAEYPFMRWGMGSKDGPSIFEEQGVNIVEVCWGGALSGHWGFSVALGGRKNEFNSSTTRVIRVSDDICFFDGD